MANTPQRLLEKEEHLGQKLDSLIVAKHLSSYQSISQIVPSFKRQKGNYELIQTQLMAPYFKKHSILLGLTNTQINNIKIDVTKCDKNLVKCDTSTPLIDKYLTIEETLDNPNLTLFKSLWIGKIDDKYSSIILLDNISSVTPFKSLQHKKEGIYFMNKVEDISNIFQKYRNISFIVLIIVYILIALLLCYRYGVYRAVFIFLPPTLAGSITLSIMGWFGYPINLFNILGLFLIL